MRINLKAFSIMILAFMLLIFVQTKEIKVDEIETTLFKSHPKEIEDTITNLLDIIDDLAKLIEKDLQDDPNKPKVRLYIDKDKSIAIIVKLADFDLVERVNKIKIDNKPEDLLPI